MSSRTPRPEDEYPPLDTDDGDRYIPTSRELAEQYRRDRSEQEAAPSEQDARRQDDDQHDGDLGAPQHDDVTRDPFGRDQPGNARFGDPVDGPADDGSGQAADHGVRVTEPVPLIPDETDGQDEAHQHTPAAGGTAADTPAAGGTAAAVDPADRAVPAADPSAAPHAGRDLPGDASGQDASEQDVRGGGDGWRDRFDHAAAMDDWDREFGDSSGSTGGTDVQEAESAAPAVGTGITETDARSDAGRAAPGATTIDRRSAATQSAPGEQVPAPLGAAAVAGPAHEDEQVTDGTRNATTAGRPDDAADREDAFGTADAGAEPTAASTTSDDDRARRDADPSDRTGQERAGIRGDSTDRDGADTDTDRDDSADTDRHAGADAIGATAAGAALAGGAVAAGTHRTERDTTSQPVAAPVRDDSSDAPGQPLDSSRRETEARVVDDHDDRDRPGVAVAELDDEEARRRATRRDAALEGKPAAGRFWQVVLAIAFPVVLLVAAIRTVASPLFLWLEYHRPGFPVDTYGYTTDDRLTWGSAVEDYINNFANPRYLTQIPGKDGGSLLTEGEVSHMVDVKNVIGITYIAAAVLAVLALIAVIYLAKRYLGGVRRGLFAGSVITLVVIIALGVFAVIDWSLFFTTFHRVLFSQGNWTFYENDALIRLFPSQFWVDSGIVIGGIVLIVSLVTLIMTWPTRRRRDRSRAAQEALRRSMAEHEEALAA
ncbi:TIGR01906 family membrane protein [Tersicoccus sp. Bi-70]|uniref:TIGR01906 family membrane protein n=1 Tax=Tersicoccus sp. Bi-70 TaxID=1897634 RepID=UPI000975B98D|nr:TIGR01906 family membrane protein [Tersicoccus sp. Bi-70]OMH31399.1 hypothetical protein BGP79_10320 [Tersicoccus sp. Bi-70]